MQTLTVPPVQQEVLVSHKRAINEAKKFNMVVEDADVAHFVGYNCGTLHLYVYARNHLYRFFHSDQASFNEHLRQVLPAK